MSVAANTSALADERPVPRPATQSDLVEDVIDVLGIDADVAGYQVSRSTETFRRSGLLEGTGALEPPPTDLDLFRDPPST